MIKGNKLFRDQISVQYWYKTWQYLIKVFAGSVIKNLKNLVFHLASVSQNSRSGRLASGIVETVWFRVFLVPSLPIMHSGMQDWPETAGQMLGLFPGNVLYQSQLLLHYQAYHSSFLPLPILFPSFVSHFQGVESRWWMEVGTPCRSGPWGNQLQLASWMGWPWGSGFLRWQNSSWFCCPRLQGPLFKFLLLHAKSILPANQAKACASCLFTYDMQQSVFAWGRTVRQDSTPTGSVV